MRYGEKFNASARSQESLLGSDVFSDVSLVEGDDVHGVSVAALGGRLGGNSEAQRQIIHAVDNDALILWSVLRDSAQT